MPDSLTVAPTGNSLGKRPRGLLKSKRGKSDATTGDERSAKRQKKQAEDLDATTTTEKSDVTLEDWEDLKELFENALEAYESDNPASAAPLLRGIIHECDRFLRHHPSDPSVIYTVGRNNPDQSDPPLAFATVQGSAIYLLGTLVRDDASIASTGEPIDPGDYFSAACNLFASTRSGAVGSWAARYEFTYGQAILAAAVETEPDDQRGGLLDAALKNASDRFAAGAKWLPPSSKGEGKAEEAKDEAFLPLGRTRTLLEASSAILSVVQQEDNAALGTEEVERWCRWTIAFLESEDDHGGEDDMVGAVEICRGKCWLALGSRYAEQCEERLESDSGDGDAFWESDLARDGREALVKALEHLRSAKAASDTTSTDTVNENDDETAALKGELHSLLGETLLTLANLTQDETTREGLYAQAKQYGVDVDAKDDDEE